MHRAFRIFCSPLVSLTLAVGIFLDARSLGPDSTVGRVFDPPEVIHRTYLGNPRVILTDDGLSISSTWPRPSDEICLGTFNVRVHHFGRGFWAVTREVWSFTVNVYPSGSQLSHAELYDLLARLTYREQDAWPPMTTAKAVIRSGGGKLERTLWSGYLHNGISSLAAACLLVSLFWIPRSAITLLAQQREAAGLCPKCSYDLRAVDSPACPECGCNRSTRDA